MLDADGVNAFLGQGTLEHSRFPDTDTWLVVLRNDAGRFYMTVALRQDWLVLTINPLIERPPASALDKLAYHLCRLNEGNLMATFYIDQDNDVGLALELPRESVDAELFRTAIGAMDYTVATHYETLQQYIA